MTAVNKRLPEGATRPASGGPYSPVLIIPSGDLVAISGQGATDAEGTIVGATIEEQTERTFENCRSQLRIASCTLDDVWKVSVYLADLSEWGRMNEVYKRFFTLPYPVRTTTGADLLTGMKVEIDMIARRG